MKNLLILIFIFCSFQMIGQSQQLDKDLERFVKLYNLDEAQATSVKTLLTKKYNDLQAIGSSNDTQEVKTRKRTALQDDYDEKFVAILNDEQKVAHQRIKMMNKAGIGDQINWGQKVDPSSIQGAPSNNAKKPASK